MQASPGKTALIIDHDLLFRNAIRTLLEGEGFRVYDTDDGNEGIDIAGREYPDVVLCDVHMKKVHGYATARAIRSNPVLASTLVILITGSASNLGENRAKNAGADFYLSKPMRGSELVALINEALKNKQASMDA